IRFGELEFGRAAAEKVREQALEMAVDGVEGGGEPFAPLAVEAADPLAQALDRLDEIVAFRHQPVAPGADLARLLVGAQVDPAETLALLTITLQPRLDLVEIGQRDIGLELGDGEGFL